MNQEKFTREQSKFFKLLMDAALDDDEIAQFIIHESAGKTSAIEQAQSMLLKIYQPKELLNLTDDQFKEVKLGVKMMLDGNLKA